MRQIRLDVSVRDQVVPVPPGGSLFQCLRELGVRSFEAAVGLDGTLPCLSDANGSPHSISQSKAIEALGQSLGENQVRISAFLLATDFGGPESERHLNSTINAVKAAHVLGVPVVRIDPLTADRTRPASAVVPNFVNHVRRVLDATTAESGVDLAMENHANLFNDFEILDRVLAEIPEPRFGLTLDTGNFYWWGHPLSRVYDLIRRYAPRTKHTHIKSINYPADLREQPREMGYEYKQFCAPLQEGDLDLKRVVQLLWDGGYRRDLCVEDESLFKFPEADRMKVLKREIQALRVAAA